MPSTAQPSLIVTHLEGRSHEANSRPHLCPTADAGRRHRTRTGGQPHFINASASLSGSNLVVKFKEAGLGNNQLIHYTASADGTATWVCVNKGGGNPSAQNKTTVNGPVTASGTFSSGKNGSISESLTINPPPSNISCPNGQSLQLASASYSNVSITDDTNGVTETIAGSFATGCRLPNVRGAC